MILRLVLLFMIGGMLFLVSGCKPKAKAQPNVEMSKSMLKLRGYKFNKVDFFRAILDGDPAFINGFVHAGMDPNVKNNEGLTALTYAIKYTNLKTIRVVGRLADINLRDAAGNSPLHLAILTDNDEAVKFFLRRRISVNTTGKSRRSKNQTPLHAAVILAKADLVKELLERGADPNVADSKGAFPLTDATGRRESTLEMIKMLVEKGADVNKAELDGVTPLIYAATNRRISSEARSSMVRYYLEKDAAREHRDKDGMTARDWALKMEHDGAAALLE